MRYFAGWMLCAVLLAGCCSVPGGEGPPPLGWTDSCAHRDILRISPAKNRHETFYFHQNPFTASGDKMVYISYDNKGSRFAAVADTTTLESKPLDTAGRTVAFETLAAKRRELIYVAGDIVCATNIDTGATREIVKLPTPYLHGRGFAINSDETLLAGCFALGEEAYYHGPKKEWERAIYEARLPNTMYTISIDTGEIREFLHGNDWYGHTQFSPTDPTLLMFCHEGPGSKPERIWLVRTDGSGLRKVHEKKNRAELLTHEFWAPDGKSIWFDFQSPGLLARVIPPLRSVLSARMYLAQAFVDETPEKRFRIRESETSWHYNIARDGKTLCGDGEGRYFRLSPSARWIYKYEPDGKRMMVTKLANMKRHSYKIPTNAHITPDGRWVVFQSDLYGGPHVYAVAAE